MDTVKNDRVLITIDRTIWSEKAAELIRVIFQKPEIIYFDFGQQYPDQVESWKGDWLINFKSDILFSQKTLLSAVKGCINFHPAPPKYRGVGGYIYALQNKDENFGVTSHHMIEKIDAGSIIKTITFPILKGETDESLSNRTGAFLLTLFYYVIPYIAEGKDFPVSNKNWGEKLYTRKGLKLYKQEHNIKSNLPL
jgi:methionyl-tRNA formyltransferase